MHDDFFTPRRQFLRVLARDWRLYRFDLLWGLFYALAGFFFATPRSFHGAPLFAPFFTLSLGVGHAEDARARDFPEVLGKADAALYASKEAGRDRVTVASDERP